MAEDARLVVKHILDFLRGDSMNVELVDVHLVPDEASNAHDVV
jgi:hypothetical protein